MSVPKQLFAEFGNNKRDNISFTINAGVFVTCHFKEDGTSDGENKYYSLGSTAKQILIRNNQIATITHINDVELQSPITLGTAAGNTWRKGIEWRTIKLRADVDATTFEIYAS